jgi:hypothetical protein
MIRKPCFACHKDPMGKPLDDMERDECCQSPLSRDQDGCRHSLNGGHWGNCKNGRRRPEYPYWIVRHGYRPVYLCPECGIIRTIDEDGCCAMCGAVSKEIGVEVNDAR